MDNEFQRLADIEVEAVRPDVQGFTLTGPGSDRADYRLDVHFELPLDARTRAVLGELLSHSDLTISRRGSQGPAPATPARRRDRAHRT